MSLLGPADARHGAARFVLALTIFGIVGAVVVAAMFWNLFSSEVSGEDRAALEHTARSFMDALETGDCPKLDDTTTQDFLDEWGVDCAAGTPLVRPSTINATLSFEEAHADKDAAFLDVQVTFMPGRYDRTAGLHDTDITVEFVKSDGRWKINDITEGAAQLTYQLETAYWTRGVAGTRDELRP